VSSNVDLAAHAAPGHVDLIARVFSSRPQRRLMRIVAAATAGLALAFSFAPSGLWWLAPFAVALLLIAVRGTRARSGIALGTVFGFACYAVLLQWMRVVGDDAWILLTLLMTVWSALLGGLLSVVSRHRWWPLWSAGVWVLIEAGQARAPFNGFNWGRLAYTQPDTWATPIAVWGSAVAVSFVIALVGGLIAAGVIALRRKDNRGLRVACALAAATIAASAFAPRLSISDAGESRDGPTSAKVAIVQGNVPRVGLDFLGQREAVLNNHIEATRQLARDVRAGTAEQPEFVVWPENSSDIDPLADAQAGRRIQGAVDDIGVPILVGAVVTDPRDPNMVLNVGIVWGPTDSTAPGPGETYIKRHPVPFGEYLPFRSFLSRYIERFDRIPRDFAAGDKPGVLTVGPARIGNVICFEITYDSIVREAVTAGGRALVVQTNNATYGLTGQTDQQLAMSRVRAVEHGRAVVVVATSGLSAVITPSGHVTWQSEEFTREVHVADIPLRDSLTIADRLGNWTEAVLAAVGLLGLVAVLWGRRRDRAERRAEASAAVT